MYRLGCLFIVWASYFLVTVPAFAASTIPFVVAMSEIVTVTGTPRIAVDVGGVTRYATYTGGSGTSSLTFTYSMTGGDVDLDGVTLISPIDLNGGAIQDLSGNAATLIYTLPDTTNVKVNNPSLGMDFIFDGDGRFSLNGVVHNDFSSFLSASGGSFSRGSIATYFDSSGALQSAAINVPRFDYDPLLHTANGILIEESRINYFKNSSALPSASNGGPTLTNNIATDPAGGLTADRVSASATLRGVYGTPGDAALTAGAQYTLSAFVKRETGVNTVIFGVPNTFTNGTGDWTTAFDFSTKSFSSTHANISNPTYRDVGNGWIRLSVTATVAAGGTGGGPLIYSLGGAMNFLVWGCQIEAGSFVTSYIPTSGSTVSRSADNFTVPAGGWYSSTSGAFISETYNGQQNRVVFDLNSDSNNYITLYNSSTWRYEVFNAAVSQSALTSVWTTANTENMALSYGSNNFQLSKEGSGASTDSSGALPTVTNLYLGRNRANSAYFQGYLRKFKYYPLQPTSAQLQLMSQ